MDDNLHLGLPNTLGILHRNGFKDGSINNTPHGVGPQITKPLAFVGNPFCLNPELT